MSTTVLWVDSDPNIEKSAYFLKEKKFTVKCFNETKDCVDYLEQYKGSDVCCIITSMMERGGRKEKGLMNAFEMIDKIKQNWKQSYSPFLVMITISADEQACKDNGFDVVVYNDRLKMQKIVSERLFNESKYLYNINEKWKLPKNLKCDKLKNDAINVLNSLNIPNDLFDHFADRCFCLECEPKLIWYRGKPSEKYVLPTNWYRFGIKIRKEYLNRQVYIYDWNVAYHGTKIRNAKSIIQHQRIMFPGDTLLDGTKLPMAHNNCFHENFKGPVIYVSPSIKYASEELYAETFRHNERNVKVAFQCRIKPGTFKKFPETLGYTGREKTIDENYPNKEIEWVTDDRYAVVPYGLLIGFF